MRVLVADRNAMLLECVSRTYGYRFSIYTATTRARCDALLRQFKFDLTVISEKLADGPGLSLLKQIARHSPNTRRVFCARRSRLRLLRGKLGPFGLFRTLEYPIVAKELLAILVLARRSLEVESPVLQQTVLQQTVRRRGPVRTRKGTTRPNALFSAAMAVVFLMTLMINAPRTYPDVGSGYTLPVPIRRPDSVVHPSSNASRRLESHPAAARSQLKPVVHQVVANASPIADPSTFGSEAYEVIYPN